MKIEITELLPYGKTPIDYFNAPTNDVVTQLQTQITAGKASLTPRKNSGYLLDLLEALEIPIESQTLVFSRTSVHQRLISPKNPRAIYFNDEVSVGWVPGAPVLEIAAQDPELGAIFYTLAQPDTATQPNAAAAQAITWRREERCLTCHVSTSTLGIPGHVLRSYQVNERGEPQTGYSQVTHSTPFVRRWGGWFVTGKANELEHLGNLFGAEDQRRHEQDPTFRGTVARLEPLVDLSVYPSAQSDLVAMLVLTHQVQFFNLVTRVQFEHRLGRQSDAEEQLARYALLLDEAALPGPVSGSTNYSTWYQSHGASDNRGHPHRELDLKTRLYRHGLSPLVRSRSCRRLPAEVKTRLWARFQQAGVTADE